MSSETHEPLVYSAPEAAEAIGVGENKIYELVAGGRIPAIKWGPKIIVIPRQALEQYLTEEAFRQQRDRQGTSAVPTTLRPPFQRQRRA
jgi:excisionase family DNA binding protein